MAIAAYLCESCGVALPSREIVEWHEQNDCLAALREQHRRERTAVCAELRDLLHDMEQLDWSRFVAGAPCRDRAGEGWNTPGARRRRVAARKARGLGPAPAGA